MFPALTNWSIKFLASLSPVGISNSAARSFLILPSKYGRPSIPSSTLPSASILASSFILIGLPFLVVFLVTAISDFSSGFSDSNISSEVIVALYPAFFIAVRTSSFEFTSLLRTNSPFPSLASIMISFTPVSSLNSSFVIISHEEQCIPSILSVILLFIQILNYY